MISSSGQPANPSVAHPAERPTILVVDDVPENLAILGELLQDQYRVRIANSGARALTAAASQPPPDLILLDIMMPGMDGYAVISELRRNAQTRDIPVIFVTAMDTAEDEERGLGLGAVDYITKPIKPAIALARIRTHIALKQARDLLADQNGFLEAEVARRMHENQLVQDIGIRALANLAETRDEETGRHIRRTQAYVELLARKLSSHPRFAHYLTPQQIATIVKAAPLHDIGKVGIPDQILRKQNTLSAEEFEIMKTHSTLGSDAIDKAMRGVLSDAEYSQLQHHCALGFQALDSANPERTGSSLGFLSVAKEIARSHHEKWDGSGYPDGLAGDAIPIPARLMALADIFDALTRQRIYKDSLPISAATEIIVHGRGTHLDPDVVDAFLESLDQFIEIAQRNGNS